MAACERIFKLMDTAAGDRAPRASAGGRRLERIEFRHVWFTYQKLTEEQKAAVAAAEESATDGAALAAWTALSGS